MRCCRAVWRASSGRRSSSTCPGRQAAVGTASRCFVLRSHTLSTFSPASRRCTARRDRTRPTAPPLTPWTGLLRYPRLFVSLVKFEHTIFALPFAYIGAFLALDAVPSAAELLWITVAMVGARSLAMALNRLIDAGLDARNPRTAGRELPRGALESWQVVSSASRPS